MLGSLGYQRVTGSQPALVVVLDAINGADFELVIDYAQRWDPQVGDVLTQGDAETVVTAVSSATLFTVKDPAGFAIDEVTVTRHAPGFAALPSQLNLDGRCQLADNALSGCTDLLFGASKVVGVELGADPGIGWAPALDADVLLVTLTANVTINELVPGWRRQVMIFNVTDEADGYELTIADGAPLANSEYGFVGGVDYGGEGSSVTGNVVLLPGEAAQVVYDAAAVSGEGRWRAMQISERPQPPGPGEWDFSDADQSGHLLTV